MLVGATGSYRQIIAGYTGLSAGIVSDKNG